MKTLLSHETVLVLERLPGLLNVRDLAASFSFPDNAVRSFPLFWLLLSLLLSLLCLSTWQSLVLTLVKWMETNDNTMVVRRSFFSSNKDKVAKSSRSSKSSKSSRRSFDGHSRKRMQESLDNPTPQSPLLSPIVTLVVSREKRLFVAHEDVLARSPFFASVLKEHFVEGSVNKALVLPDEEPEILSCILEFLYKGDYSPRLIRKKNRNTWELEKPQDSNTPSGGCGPSDATIFHSGVGDVLLRDTVVYCAAEKYGLEELKTLALRKQGLRTGIPMDVVLRSARYAYDNTPDTEYRLRAHYLAMIIRTRDIFKRSGTMQFEMEMGHKFFFDLFVAMSNRLDDLEEMKGK